MREKKNCMLERLLDLLDTKLKENIKRAPKNFIKLPCEFWLNNVNGNVPISKSFVECYEKSFRRQLSRQTLFEESVNFLLEKQIWSKPVGLACYLI